MSINFFSKLKKKTDNTLSDFGFADDSTLPRILGAYSVLKALALIHCTLYIHYKPLVKSNYLGFHWK